MKKITVIVIAVFMMGMMTYPVKAATIGYVDVQKVFTDYEKTKKAQEDMKKKEQVITDEITKKQQQVDKERSNGMSDKELRNLVSKLEKEMEPKKTAIVESKKKMTQEIQDDIIKATEAIAKKMGIEIVLDKHIFITGGIDLTDKVIELLNKK